jgi:hypothetical protein
MEKKKQVLLAYNYSDPYVEMVLQIAQKLSSKQIRGKGKE